MSCTYTQAFHTLEFRHGPKAIVSGATLISFLLSEQNHEAELEVAEEVRNQGARTVIVAKRITDRAHAAADLAVDLDCDLPEPVCLAPFVFAGQLVGVYNALRKALDPDRPINLSRVVVLADENEQPKNAPI
jgi:glucosamine--fructose-6-phosphate aminotransferase (isomerizing)